MATVGVKGLIDNNVTRYPWIYTRAYRCLVLRCLTITC